MAKATTAQIRMIHALAKERGMDSELLHAYIKMLVKKDSIAKLSIVEAINVIDGFTGKKLKETNPKTEWATEKQRDYINGLMKNIGWIDEDGKPEMERLNGLLSNRFRIDSVNWLTRSKASQVIEALKAMAERTQEDEQCIKM